MFSLLSVVCYVLLVVAVQLRGRDLQAQLMRFDLDGDGSFSGYEQTPPMLEAMDRVTSDTGSALAPITGIPLSILYVGFNCLIFYKLIADDLETLAERNHAARPGRHGKS